MNISENSNSAVINRASEPQEARNIVVSGSGPIRANAAAGGASGNRSYNTPFPTLSFPAHVRGRLDDTVLVVGQGADFGLDLWLPLAAFTRTPAMGEAVRVRVGVEL